MCIRRVLGLVVGMGLLLCCWSRVARAAEAASKSIGFSKLVFRPEGGDVIGIANEDFRVYVLEELRRNQLNAVGAENLVFGQDKGEQATLLLGGTVTELECQPGTSSKRVSCRIGIEWQVLDVASNAVVYKVLSRSKVHNVSNERPATVGKQLILQAVGSLSGHKKFRKLLVADAPVTPQQGYATASLQRCSAPARSMPAASEAVLDATVLVQTSQGFGSGFMLSSDGFVATAAHVLTGPSATVRLRDGREFPASVVRVDKRLDIALLRIATAQAEVFPCLPIKAEPMPIGSDVYAIGSPASRDLSFSLARGIVSGVRLLDGVQYLQTDAAINRGNSGGPLVTGAGEAAAIVSFKLVGSSMEGLAFGVPLAAGLNTLGVSLADGFSSQELVKGAAVGVSPTHVLVVDTADAVPSLSQSDSLDSEPEQATPGKRRSTGMMVGGILMTSMVPIALMVSLVASTQQSICETSASSSYDYYSGTYYGGTSGCSDYDTGIYGGLVSAVILGGIGIPLIVVGAKKVPAAPATTLRPWVTRQAAGVGLRVDL